MIDKTKLKIVEKEIKEHISIPYMFNNILGFYGNIASESVCCPFHGEKSPSFSYSEALDIWTCFGECSKSGDVIEMYRFYLKKNKGLEVSRTKTVEMLMTLEVIKPYLTLKTIELERTNKDFKSYLDFMTKAKHKSLDVKTKKRINAVNKVINSKYDEQFIKNYNLLLWSGTNVYESEE